MYKNVNTWVEIVNYNIDLPSEYPLNQKVKAEDISRFQREIFRYNAYKQPTKTPTVWRRICCEVQHTNN